MCSDDLVTVKSDDNLGRAVDVMREHFVRRVPVVDKAQQAVGIVSIGDLAVERDRSPLSATSALRGPTRSASSSIRVVRFLGTRIDRPALRHPTRSGGGHHAAPQAAEHLSNPTT